MYRKILTAEEKAAARNKVQEELFFRHGPRALLRAAANNLFIQPIPTGLDGLDTALGIGGIPKGRIVEIHGDAGSGKTALALYLAHQVSTALYIDADYGLTPTQGAGLYMARPDTLEDALGICETAAPAFGMIVIDSIPALPARSNLEIGISDCYTSYARSTTARILARALPRLLHALNEHGCTLVLVTQIRENPENVDGNPEFALGGRALKHYASVSLEVFDTGKIRRKNVIAGQRVQVRVVKNKCGPEQRKAFALLQYEAPADKLLTDAPPD